ILNSNNVPAPESGAKSVEKAEMRNVLIGPEPGRTLPETFQLPAVRPALCTGVLSKVTTLSSKIRSPWNATKLLLASISEVVTGATKLWRDCSTVISGRVNAATPDSMVGASSGGPPSGRGKANGLAQSPKTTALKFWAAWSLARA